MDARITHRDFVNGSVAAVAVCATGLTAVAAAALAVDPWTGPGGIGDRARANGSTRGAGYGRVRFAHAELQGNQSILSSALEAERAIHQVGAFV